MNKLFRPYGAPDNTFLTGFKSSSSLLLSSFSPPKPNKFLENGFIFFIRKPHGWSGRKPYSSMVVTHHDFRLTSLSFSSFWYKTHSLCLLQELWAVHHVLPLNSWIFISALHMFSTRNDGLVLTPSPSQLWCLSILTGSYPKTHKKIWPIFKKM